MGHIASKGCWQVMAERADPGVMRRIANLEKAATHVLEKKRRLRSRRPIVIEFAGSPKSGKSSCISSLDIFLRRNKFRTRVLTERASVCPLENKFDPLFNVWTGCASLNQLVEILSKESKYLDVVIIDRGFFDALIWFEWQRTHFFLREADYDNFRGFFTSPRFRMMIDLVMLFECDAEISIEREYKNLLTRKEGSIMRPRVLESYKEAASIAVNKYNGIFRAMSKFDTGRGDQNQVGFEVTKQVIAKLKEVADEKIGYVEIDVISSIRETVFNYLDLEKKMGNCLSFDFRDSVEPNKELVQFIPIAVVKDRNSSRVLTGRKAAKATSTGSPEKDKMLLYFGGHVREEDKTLFDSPTDLDVFKQALYREIKEEIGLDIDCAEMNPKCIWVRDGRSNCHLAIVFLVERNLDHVKPIIDGDEFVRGEKRATTPTGHLADADELRDEYGNLDSWSQNIITHVLRLGLGEKRSTHQPSLL